MKRILLLLLIVPTLVKPIICYDKKRRMYYSSYYNNNINKHVYNYLACRIDLVIMLNHNRVAPWMIADTIYEILFERRTNESRLLYIDIQELANLN
jgi:hypothetical protein